MGRRGRRQVLQLDDSSCSHNTRGRYGFCAQQTEEKRISNPLLNLVGDYNSDSDEEENVTSDEEVYENTSVIDNGVKSKTAEVELVEPLLSARESGPMADGKDIDSEVANFLAEIESISSEPIQTNRKEEEHITTLLAPVADFGGTRKENMGYIIKINASLDKTEETGKSTKHIYKSMFVQGESEFIKQEENMKEKGNKDEEEEEELPEEPKSEWQIVQDETTQYYYYWNIQTNEVTWEIPPSYTQFLLLYKEYEEKLSKISKEKLELIKEKREFQKQQHIAQKEVETNLRNSHPETIGKECSPFPEPEQSLEKSFSSKKLLQSDNEAEFIQDTILPSLEIGPQLPSLFPQKHHKVRENTSTEKLPENVTTEKLSEIPSTEKFSEITFIEKASEIIFTDKIDITSPVKLSEITSIEKLSENASTEKLSEDTSLEKLPEGEKEVNGSLDLTLLQEVPVLTSPALDPEVSLVTSIASIDSNGVDSGTSISMPDTAFSTVEASSSSSLNSSLIIDLILQTNSPIDKDILSLESVVHTHKEGKGVDLISSQSEERNVPDSTEKCANDGEEDDFDVDFDDIDDLDRALEKALEKKLEKKKAELRKLEQAHFSGETFKPTTSPPPPPSQTWESTIHKQEFEADLNLPQFESAADAMVEQKEITSSSTKRSVSVVTSVRSRVQEPELKKARLVAYDPLESDESMEDSDDSTTLNRTKKVLSESEACEILTAPPPPETSDNLAEIQEMAETALDKLAFLEVSTTGLSRLQITLVQLQTRLKDWLEGGLNAEYFFQRIAEVGSMLQQYEMNAVPPDWACHWDSSTSADDRSRLIGRAQEYRRSHHWRYFYTNLQTGESQWDYPDIGTRDEASGSKKENGLTGNLAALVDDSIDRPNTKNGNNEEDLDGVAMDESDDITKNFLSAKVSSVDGCNKTSNSVMQRLFPGEPLPPGTELLLGLPPPPPPPLSPTQTYVTDFAYSSKDNSSSTSDSDENDEEQVGDMYKENILSDIQEGIKVEELPDWRRSEKTDTNIKNQSDDPAVISKPPQLRFPLGTTIASFSAATLANAKAPMGSNEPFSHIESEVHHISDFSASVGISNTVNATGIGQPTSPLVEDLARNVGSPATHLSQSEPGIAEPRHDKLKKKKKDKLTSSGLSLKKKGVSSLVQKWQKVKREVEQEERANEQRQLAIRHQLDELKKDNR